MLVTGTVLAVVIVAALAFTATRVVSRVLPGWIGPHRWLAEAVVGLAVLFAALQLAGSVDGFARAPIVALVLLFCVGALLIVPVLPRSSHVVVTTPSSRGRFDVIALVVLAVVGLQWLSHTIDALSRGLTHPDTLWYHIPFAARFVQVRSFTGLDGLGYEAARWFPFDSQSLHALGIALLRRDAISPLLNLGWAALAVLAAWAVGERRGDRATALLGLGAALGLPVLAATQPGQASSDIACAALLLAAVALLLASDLEPGPIALAGLALGLAIATKVTIAVPVAVLVLGVAAVGLARRRWSSVLAWLVGVAVTGSYWFVRDWIGAGTPLPWLDVSVGPIHLPAVVDEGGKPLADELFDGDAWRSFHLPGLEQGLGRAWPLVLAGVVVAAASLIVGRRRSALERVIGVAVAAGLVGYVFTPLTGGFSFVFNLRYLSPVLVLGFVLLAGRWRVPVAVGLVIVATSNALTAHHERVSAWPGSRVLVALAVLAVIAVSAVALTRATRHVGLLQGVVVALLVVGWFGAATHYERHRYVDAHLHTDALNRWFRDVHDADVAVLGTDETMPMFGLDLSNRVRRADDPPPHELTCEGWRRALDRYDYVVITELGFSLYYKPEPFVLGSDPGARPVLDGDTGTIYAIDSLHPEACPQQ